MSREAMQMALEDLLIIWNDSRPSVSALRAALAEQPAAPVGFARICDSLPEGVNWGDPLTPAMAIHIFESAIPPGCVMVSLEKLESLRFVQRVLESDAPQADRDAAAQMVRDLRAALAARPGEKHD